MNSAGRQVLVSLGAFLGAFAWAQAVQADTQNLALLTGAKASQSSEGFGGSAARAIDGNTDGAYAARSVSHTNSEATAWWQLGLRKPATVNRVVLWNRTDCCADRLASIRVRLLDADSIELWKVDYSSLEEPRRLIVDIPNSPLASTVRVEFLDVGEERTPDQSYLSLAEVQVFGEEPLEVVPTIREIHEVEVLLMTTQQPVQVFKNTTSNKEKQNIITKKVQTFNSKASVESIREESRSSQFNLSVSATTNISAGVENLGSGSASVAATAGAQYANLVKTYFKTTGEVEEYKSFEETIMIQRELSPGDEVRIYTNKTSGGTFEYSWNTFEPLTEEQSQPIRVLITVEHDLTPAFNEMCAMVVDVNNGIGNSGTKSNWIRYANICLDARTKGIRHYIKEVQKQLNSHEDFDDDYSWRMVKEAARTADETSNDAIALSNVLGGFLKITQPSKDVWAWGKLKTLSRKLLYQRS